MKRSPVKGRSNVGSSGSTRLAVRRMDDLSEDESAFFEGIVRRTNALFVKLNITTRPIQAFEELQKSASSMFVAIFETLFNVRLKNVIRKPRVVTDYITNAQLVMTALSESLQIDLSFLSGEAIFHGDPIQIHHMLSIFESLWTQLFSQNETDSAHQLPTSQSSISQEKATEDQEKSVAPKRDTSTEVNSQEAISMADLENREEDKVKGKREMKLERRNTGANRTVKKRGKKRTALTTNTATKEKTQSDKPRRGQTAGRSSTVASQRRSKRLMGKNDENAEDLHARVERRKALEKNLPETKGFSTLNKGARLARESMKSETSFKSVKQETDMSNIKALARQYPTIYRTVWRKSALGKEDKSSTTTTHSRGRPSNPLATQMEKDLERYKKAYSLLVKHLEAEMRKNAVNVKRDAQLKAKVESLDERIEEAKSHRMEQDLSNLEKSRSLRKKNKEEVLVHNLFRNALKLEHEYVLARKQFELEERRKVDEERLNKYESLKRYYLDREAMLQDKIDNDRRDKKISDDARRIALKQLENQLRNEYQAKLEEMANQWEQRDQQEQLSTQENLTSMFDSFNQRMANSFRSVR